MGNSKKLRVLIVTTNPPLKTTGGSLLFYRQFVEREDYTVAVMSDTVLGSLEQIPWLQVHHGPLIQRLIRTRLSLWIHDYIHLFAGRFVRREWLGFAREFSPDLIIGGAETWMMDLALSLGRRLNVPVAGFFMDWPTYASLGHSWCMKRLGEHFKMRYRSSDAAFCISPEMKEALGPHPNSHIYYPSAEWRELPGRDQQLNPKDCCTLFFAGNLGQWYGHAVDALMKEVRNHAGLRVIAAGTNPPWTGEEIRQLNKEGRFLGFLNREDLDQAMMDADVLLVIMGFDEESRHIESTSFKSKIVEYLIQQKPILIWGPEYCTAVRHGREAGFAEIVTSPSPRAVVEALESLCLDPARRQRLVDNGRRFFKDNLDAEKVHREVMEEFIKLARSGRSAD